LDPEIQQKVRAIYGLFATGNYAGALQRADDELAADQLSPNLRTWIMEQMPALLISAGWSSLKLGDCETATAHLRRAAALKHTLEGAKGLALCYFKQKNFIGAEEQFQAYFEMGENDPTMQLLYADLMESESRYEEAVAILEKLDSALASAPPQDGGLRRESLQQRLTSMRGRAKVGQDQRSESSRNFRLSFRSGEHEELVAWVTTGLEEALDRYVEDYGFRLPPAPIEVLLYPSQEFSSVMVGSPTWAEGLFDGRIRVPVPPRALKQGYDGDAQMAIVLRHELVHALFAILTGGRPLPPWFDEGMAQRLSCPREGCPPFTFPPTPGDFLAEPHFLTPFTSFNSTMAGRAYQQGLYLILTLEELRGESALREIVTRMAQGSDVSSDGLLRSVGLTLAELHKTASFRWTKRWVPR
jgi:tetratricopeptide (TPR) repeat protein